MRNRTSAAVIRAFSLFEIAVALTILGLISGAIFSILWQAGATATEIRDLDRREEEVSRFLALLRESIEHLPQDGTLELIPAEESTSGYPELKIGNSATAFTFGEIVGSSEESVISLRPGPEGAAGEPTFDLALSRPDLAPRDTDGSGLALRVSQDDFLQSDEEGRYWLPLLSGVTAAAWTFWDEDQQAWLEEWTDDSRLPPLLAFSLDDGFRPAPLQVVFEVPEQVSNPQTETETATATSGTGSGGASAARGRRGGDGEGRGRGDGKGRPGRGDGDGGGRPGRGDGAGRPGGPGGAPAGGPGGGGRPSGGSGRPSGGGGGGGNSGGGGR